MLILKMNVCFKHLRGVLCNHDEGKMPQCIQHRERDSGKRLTRLQNVVCILLSLNQNHLSELSQYNASLQWIICLTLIIGLMILFLSSPFYRQLFPEMSMLPRKWPRGSGKTPGSKVT